MTARAAPPPAPAPAARARDEALVALYRAAREVAHRRWRYSRTPEERDDAASEAFLSYLQNHPQGPEDDVLSRTARRLGQRAGNFLADDQLRRRRAARAVRSLAGTEFTEQVGTWDPNDGGSRRALALIAASRSRTEASNPDRAEDDVIDALDAARAASRDAFHPHPATTLLLPWCKALASLRERGWSLDHVGAAIGVSRAAVSLWSTGRCAPHRERAMALSRLAATGEGPPAGSGRAAAGGRRTGDPPGADELADPVVLRALLASLRARGWGSTRLARALGVGADTPCRWARGSASPQPDLRRRLAAFAVDPGGWALPSEDAARVARRAAEARDRHRAREDRAAALAASRRVDLARALAEAGSVNGAARLLGWSFRAAHRRARDWGLTPDPAAARAEAVARERELRPLLTEAVALLGRHRP